MTEEEVEARFSAYAKEIRISKFATGGRIVIVYSLKWKCLTLGCGHINVISSIYITNIDMEEDPTSKPRLQTISFKFISDFQLDPERLIRLLLDSA